MRKKLLFGLLAVALALGTVLVGCAAPAPKEEGAAPTPEKVYEWKLSCSTVRGGIQYILAEEFAADIESMSSGRIKIRVFAESEIMGAEEYLDALAGGVFQIGDTNLAKQTGKVPSGSVYYALPFGISEPYQINNLCYDEGVDDWMREQLAPQGVYYLGGRVMGGFALWSKEPINRLADLKGMKVRAFGAPADAAAAWGASIVYVPWTECYLAVSTGVIDAVGTMIQAGYDAKLYEPCKGLLGTTITPWTNGSLLASMDAWNELPDDLKAIVTAAGENWSFRAERRLSQEEWIKSEIQKKHGVTVTYWPDEDIDEARELTMPVWGKLAAEDPTAAELLELKVDYMRDMGYPVD